MEVDEPYDFTVYHSSVSTVKDKKKDKKRPKELGEEAKTKAGKAEKKKASTSKRDSNRKRKKGSSSEDESNSDRDVDSDEDPEGEEAPPKKKIKASESAELDSGSESEPDSSSEDSDDPDTQPPPKSKRKKPRKNKSKKATNEDSDGEDENVEAPETEHGDQNEDSGEGKKKRKKDKKKKSESLGQKGEFGIWIGNLSFLTTEKALRHFFKDVGAAVTRVNMPSGPPGPKSKTHNKGFAYVDFASAEAQVNAIKLSNTYLDGRKVLIKSSKSYEGRPALSKAAVLEKSSKQKHNTSPTLFVGNLSFQTTKEGLQELFEDCGEIRKVRLATFEDSGKCKGFAYIDYMSPESAAKALTDPKKYFFQGRKLNVEYASEVATLRGNPREYRKHLRDEEDKKEREAKGAEARAANGGNDTVSTEAVSLTKDEEQRIANAEQKAKRLRRQPGEAPAKKLQAHQRPGLALANAPRASQGIAEYKGSKITF